MVFIDTDRYVRQHTDGTAQVHVQINARGQGRVLDIHIELVQAVGFQHTLVVGVIDRSVILH